MRNHLLPILLLIALPALATADECSFSVQRDFDVDAAGVHTLALTLGASDAVVEGVANLDKIEVRGKACASEQAWLDGLGLAQKRDGDRLTVTTRAHPDHGGFFSGYAYIGLHVRVPSTLAVTIVDGAGDATVNHVAALDFEAGSGDLRIGDIAGALALQVASSDVSGSGIGSVEVRSTASGDIRLDEIRGDVRVTRAGAGDLHFESVGGAVAIGRVGAGDVSVRHAGGDVVIESIGSGDLDVEDVAGDLTVGTHGSGEISHRNVRGRITLPPQDD